MSILNFSTTGLEDLISDAKKEKFLTLRITMEILCIPVGRFWVTSPVDLKGRERASEIQRRSLKWKNFWPSHLKCCLS